MTVDTTKQIAASAKGVNHDTADYADTDNGSDGGKQSIRDGDKAQALLYQQHAFVYEQKVAWGEMDAFSHLNNVVYYRYAESARIGYLTALDMFDNDMQVVLAQSSCQYMSPVTFPDTLYIGVRCQSIGNSSMVTSYSYYSQAQRKIVATAEAVLVRLHAKTGQKLAWTDKERRRITEFDAQPRR